MSKERILITVKTYPTLSGKHGELVCTAGVREDGSWIRLYPIPFRLLGYDERYSKFDWIETTLVKSSSDERPETYHPVDVGDIAKVGKVGVVARRAQAVAGFAETQLSVNPPSFTLSVTSLVGTVSQVQYTASLSQTNSWIPLTNFVLASSPYSLVDTTSPVTGNRFYRLLQTGLPVSIPTNPSPATLLWIPSGAFVMGSPVTEVLRSSDEVQHNVTLTSGFYMGINPVTQAEYAAMTGSNPSYFSGNDQAPVESVDWAAAIAYCAALTAQQQSAGLIPTNWVYRLPTEAEWEYACRAGTTTAFNLGPNLYSGMANFNGTEQYVGGLGTVYDSFGIDLAETVTVGVYQPNAFGLYEMHGNVCEWCQDWYGPYPTGRVTDPTGPATGAAHVYRGGSWRGYGDNLRSAVRYSTYTSGNYNVVGFRAVLAAVAQ